MPAETTPWRRSSTPTCRGAGDGAGWLQSLPEPHILFDRHYRILAANPAYLRQFGHGPGSWAHLPRGVAPLCRAM